MRTKYLPREELKCALTTHLAQSVMTSGMKSTQELSVENWDTRLMVSIHFKFLATAYDHVFNVVFIYGTAA